MQCKRIANAELSLIGDVQPGAPLPRVRAMLEMADLLAPGPSLREQLESIEAYISREGF